MMAGKARDPLEAQRLIDEVGLHEATTPLPPRKPNVWKRIKSIIRRLEGSLEHDPENAQRRYWRQLRSGKLRKRLK